MKNLLLAAMLFCTNIAIAQGTIEDYRRARRQQEKNSVQTKYPIPIGQSGVDW